jgi:hypothetical protein
MEAIKMRKYLRSLPLIVAFILMVSILLAGPGMQLGRVSLGRAPAPALNVLGPINMRSARFVSAVGGVAFGQIAKPALGLTVSQLDLSYDSTKQDGARAVLRINGVPAVVGVYDWQLIPIARFADSTQASCVTAFGTLHDQDKEKQIIQADGKIINYHPALINTLLGLRLMQADIMLFVPDAIDLPKENATYLLGVGEPAPNLQRNMIGWRGFDGQRSAAQAAFGAYRSYVLSDEDVSITFDIAQGKLSITGDPMYHFWRYRYEAPDYDAKGEPARVSAQVAARMNAARFAPGFSEKAWLIAETLDAICRIEHIGGGGTAKVTEKGLAMAEPYELRAVLVKILVTLKAQEVDVMKGYTAQVSKPSLVEAINPTVYAAARATMRYAAFLRYVRNKHPVVWKRFLASTAGKTPSPAVQTPTTMTL